MFYNMENAKKFQIVNIPTNNGKSETYLVFEDASGYKIGLSIPADKTQCVASALIEAMEQRGGCTISTVYEGK